MTKLDKALASVDKDLNTTQKNLKEVERLLKLDPGNVELLDQKQRLLSKAVEETGKRYDTLKKTLNDATASNVQAEKWAEAQKQFSAEITRTENALGKLLQEQKLMEGLKFAPDSAEMADLQRQIDATRQKSEDLRRQSARTFEELGRPIPIEQYDALQRELVQTQHDMNEAAKAAKDFETGSGELHTELSDVDATGGQLNEVLGKLGLSMKDLTMAGVVGLAVAAIKEMVEWTAAAVKGAAEYADNILTLSTNFGIATDKLQEYQYMSELIDTDMNTITGSITKLTQTMQKAREGNEAASQAFTYLSTNIYNADGTLRDASDVFEEIIGKMAQMKDGSERDALAMTLFGRSAMDLNSLMSAVANGSFKELQEEAHRLGYVLSDEELNALGQVDDGFQRLDKVMEMIKNRVAIELAPELIDLTQQLLDVATTVDWPAFGKAAASALRAAVPVVVTLAKSLAGLAMAFTALIEAISNLKAPDNAKLTAGMNRSSGRGSRTALPAYADGGVVAPNNPMLAVVGDNRTEREIIAPESLVRGAVADALAENGGAGGTIVVNATFTASDDQLVRVLAPQLDAYYARRGAVL